MQCHQLDHTICKQSAPLFRQITTPASHHSIFTGQMLCLMPNQQCKSTEGRRLVNNNNNNFDHVYIAIITSHDQSHCESSPFLFDECRLSAGWPPALSPRQLTWAVSPPNISCYHPHPASPLLLLPSP